MVRPCDVALSIRAMQAGDIEAGLRLCRAARWNQLSTDWQRFLRLNPAGAWVAEAEQDGVVGTVTSLHYAADVEGAAGAEGAAGVEGASVDGTGGVHAARGVHAAGGIHWLAMVLVSPDHQRQGIATRLLHTALSAIGDAAIVRLDATPAGEGLYRQLAFEPEQTLVRLARPAAPLAAVIADDAHVDAWSVDAGSVHASWTNAVAADTVPAHTVAADAVGVHAVRPLDDARDWPEILALDREAFGADRTQLLRMLRDEAPAFAYVARTGARLDGAVVGRHGFGFEQIGPLIARNAGTARALVRTLLRQHPGTAFILDAPRRAGGDPWAAWLADAGFREQRPFVRLVRGAPGRAIDARVYATAGPDLG